MPPPIDNALISSNSASGLAVRGRLGAAWPAVPTGLGSCLTGDAGAGVTTSASATGAGAVTAGAAATGAGAVVVLDVDVDVEVVVVAVVVESACATSVCTGRGAVDVESAVVVD